MRCCDALKNDHMERIEGIEPSWLAWEARTLPLSYTRVFTYFSPSKQDGVTECGPKDEKRNRVGMKHQPCFAVGTQAQGDQVCQ